jgi:bifunctional non-homologous end joining protein LigD
MPNKELPPFIPPMLAQPAEPFDSDDYLYEIKWDGTRALAFIEDGSYRLVNRRKLDMTGRYPDFEFLKNLPPGTVLDGEMVVLKGGKPDFSLLESREQARTPNRIRDLARSSRATYIVFDLLYEDYQPLLTRPLIERRERLTQLVRQVKHPRLVLSEAVVGRGKAFFAEACRQNLEGVVAKRLQSRYLPGLRTEAWFKIKRQSELICAIIGFLPSGPDDFRSLILAVEDKGKLQCAGKVGSGFTNAMRKRINELLWSRLRPKPVIPCKLKGKWIEPGLFCRVRFMERTESGDLRGPAFKELLVRE